MRGGNHAVPILKHEFTLGLHFGAQGLGNVDVETDQFAIRGQFVERRIVATNANTHTVGGLNRTGGQHYGDGSNGRFLENGHETHPKWLSVSFR